MAPVGRWQQGRDLSWYTKADDDSAETQRNEELRRVKEAEQDAMARALGLPVAPKSTNANSTPLGGKDVDRALKETAADDDNVGDGDEGVRGVGFGSFGGVSGMMGLGDQPDRLEAVDIDRSSERQGRRSGRRHHDDGDRARGRSRDRDRDRERKSRRRDYDTLRNERRKRSRSRDRAREHRRRGSTSRSEDKDRRHRKRHRHSRSRSPETRKEGRYERSYRYDERR